MPRIRGNLLNKFMEQLVSYSLTMKKIKNRNNLQQNHVGKTVFKIKNNNKSGNNFLFSSVECNLSSAVLKPRCFWLAVIIYMTTAVISLYINNIQKWTIDVRIITYTHTHMLRLLFIVHGVRVSRKLKLWSVHVIKETRGDR